MAIESIAATVTAGAAGLALVFYASRKGWIGHSAQAVQISSGPSNGNSNTAVEVNEPITDFQPIAPIQTEEPFTPAEHYEEHAAPASPPPEPATQVEQPSQVSVTTLQETPSANQGNTGKPKHRASRKTGSRRRSKKTVKAD